VFAGRIPDWPNVSEVTSSLEENRLERGLFQILTGRYPLANIVEGGAGNVDEQCTQVLVSRVISGLAGEKFM
jgi:hypothetical protein